MKTTLAVIVALTLSVNTICAQQEGTKDETAQKQESTGAVQGRMIIASATEDGDGPKIQYFSTSPDGAMGGDFVMMANPAVPGMGSPDPYSLVNNQSVQKEIELVDDQLNQIKDIRKDFSKQMQERLGDFTKSGFDPSRATGLKELVSKLQSEQQQQMENILLPHQVQRLKQIALQMQMKGSGEAETLASEKVADALGISDKQQQRLKDRAKEIQKELDDQIKKLKLNAKQKLLGELSRDQRKKLKEMTGEAFEMKTESWRDRVKRIKNKSSSETKDN